MHEHLLVLSYQAGGLHIGALYLFCLSSTEPGWIPASWSFEVLSFLTFLYKSHLEVLSLLTFLYKTNIEVPSPLIFLYKTHLETFLYKTHLGVLCFPLQDSS